MNLSLINGKLSLVPYRKMDIYKIMKWRNDQIDILRQNTIIKRKQQESYYENSIHPTLFQRNPRQQLFSYLLDGKCIGYGGLTNIDWKSRSAELSFLVKTARANNLNEYKGDFSSFLFIIKKIAFEELKLARLHTETYAPRKDHIKILEANGFMHEKTIINHVKIKGIYENALIHVITKDKYESEK